MTVAVIRRIAVPTASGLTLPFALSLAASCVVKAASSEVVGRRPCCKRVTIMLRFFRVASSSAILAQCSFRLPSGLGCLLRGYRLRCRASAGIKGSPLLGGSEAGATKRCCRVILNSALNRARSTGLVVYFGGDVRMELAPPTFPSCVSVSTRCASLVSSGDSACGVCERVRLQLARWPRSHSIRGRVIVQVWRSARR